MTHVPSGHHNLATDAQEDLARRAVAAFRRKGVVDLACPRAFGRRSSPPTEGSESLCSVPLLIHARFPMLLAHGPHVWRHHFGRQVQRVEVSVSEYMAQRIDPDSLATSADTQDVQRVLSQRAGAEMGLTLPVPVATTSKQRAFSDTRRSCS